MSDVVFNPEQVEVINSTAKRLAVVAGPGSGKTATLIGKINALPRESLGDLAVITFTSASAGEIRRRLGETNAFVGTLHSWCLQFLKRHGHLVGLSPRFAVVSQYDADAALEQAIMDSRRAVSKEEVYSNVQWAWLVKGQLDGKSDVEVTVAAYCSRLWAENRLDYNGLLQLTLLILQEHRDKVETPKILFVDEAQDSSEIDWMIYDAWNPEVRVIIGDPDQSIYAFRGAVPRVFVDNALAGDSILTLSTSYRSDKMICAVANALMEKVPGRLEKNIVSTSKRLGSVRFNGFEESMNVEKYIVDWVKRQPAEGSWAILCRTNREVQSIQQLLKLRALEFDRDPHVSAVNQLSALVDVIAHPWSEAIAVKALKLFRRDLNGRQILRASIEARAGGVTPGDMVAKFLPEMAGAEQIRKYPLNKHLWKPILEAARTKDVCLIPVIIDGLQFGATIEDLALEVADFDDVAKFQSRTVRTIHRAKGLEWNSVLVPNLIEGMFPPPSGDEEESRRLLFVAMTRARNNFTGLYDSANPSRFLLNVIPENL